MDETDVLETVAEPLAYAQTNFRQSDFISEIRMKTPVILIGAGGIGSPTALILKKMGLTDIKVVDFDDVELHNTGAQLYGPAHTDRKKVFALAEILENVDPTGTGITAIDQRFEDGSDMQIEEGTIIISGVDSMAARKTIWDIVKDFPIYICPLYIDARMALEDLQIFSVDRIKDNAVERYEKTLWDDTEIDPALCSAQSVAYNGFFVASVIGSHVSKYLRDVKVPFDVRGDLALTGLEIVED